MNHVDLSYIEKTESFIESRNDIPSEVYTFIKQVCQDERKYFNLIKQWSEEKKVLKVKQV